MSADHPVSLRPEEVAWLRDESTVVRRRPALFRVEGPGAVDCLQGVLTSDVVRPGPDSASYGAMLTVKGMILVDLWAIRDDLGFTLVIPPRGQEAATELFRRQFPPRLARVKEVSEELEILELYGIRAAERLEHAGVAFPAVEGRVIRTQWSGAGHSLTVARGWKAVPWRAMVLGTPSALESLSGAVQAAGALEGTANHVEAARILAGWPALGMEIGDKTLPQEVRYDEIGGVSYTKGCYVGQETVARVHFRGHPNRHLRGLMWENQPVAPGAPVTTGDREVGRLTSVLEVGNRGYGLALLRREVEPNRPVVLAETTTAVVCDLPFPER